MLSGLSYHRKALAQRGVSATPQRVWDESRNLRFLRACEVGTFRVIAVFGPDPFNNRPVAPRVSIAANLRSRERVNCLLELFGALRLLYPNTVVVKPVSGFRPAEQSGRNSVWRAACKTTVVDHIEIAGGGIRVRAKSPIGITHGNIISKGTLNATRSDQVRSSAPAIAGSWV
jgi:hypothetical protein